MIYLLFSCSPLMKVTLDSDIAGWTIYLRLKVQKKWKDPANTYWGRVLQQPGKMQQRSNNTPPQKSVTVSSALKIWLNYRYVLLFCHIIATLCFPQIFIWSYNYMDLSLSLLSSAFHTFYCPDNNLSISVWIQRKRNISG